MGRKAQMAWAAFIMTNIWFGFSYIDQATYMTMVSLLFGTYSTANIAAKKVTGTT